MHAIAVLASVVMSAVIASIAFHLPADAELGVSLIGFFFTLIYLFADSLTP